MPEDFSQMKECHRFTCNGVSKELAAANSDAASDEEADGPLVEQLEGEVVDGDLPDAQHHLRRPLDQTHRRRHLWAGSQGWLVRYQQVLRCYRGVTIGEIPGHKILARARGELCGPEKAL